MRFKIIENRKRFHLLGLLFSSVFLSLYQGIGIFKEFLQNADDAQAQDFSLLYDYGSYSNDNLFNEQLAEWQGKV